MRIEDLLNIVERDAAWRWICSQYLPGGARCPKCGALITGERAVAAFREGKEKTFCASCSSSFRSRAITPLVGTEWGPEEYVKLLWLDQVRMSAGQIAGILGKSPRCVRDMRERIMLLHPEPLPFDEHPPGGSRAMGVEGRSARRGGRG